MLDACAELIDEVGYDGLSTTLLAERAGVAIGSVYQFFPDKRAIVQALTLRNVEAYLDRLAERIPAGELPHWTDGVDGAIAEYIELHRSVPGFRTLHFGDVVDVHLIDPERDNNAVIADHLADLLVRYHGAPDSAELRFSLTISVETADALIKLAFRRQPDGDDSVLEEAKRLVRGYLRQ
jgi:AcrR family transcriptional regulator